MALSAVVSSHMGVLETDLGSLHKLLFKTTDTFHPIYSDYSFHPQKNPEILPTSPPTQIRTLFLLLEYIWTLKSNHKK